MGEMMRRDFRVSFIHSEHDEREQDLILREFNHGPGIQRILIAATDRPGRWRRFPNGRFPNGIPVVNYDIPTTMEDYLQRVGRQRSRFGSHGVALNFVTNSDVRKMKDIEKHYHIQIEEMPMDIADLI